MYQSFRRLGVDEPSSSFDSYDPPRYNYPPPPPHYYPPPPQYRPPPPVYYPPRQSSFLHFASSSSSSHYHDHQEEDSREAFQETFDYLFGGHGIDNNSQSMSDDYEEPPQFNE